MCQTPWELRYDWTKNGGQVSVAHRKSWPKIRERAVSTERKSCQSYSPHKMSTVWQWWDKLLACRQTGIASCGHFGAHNEDPTADFVSDGGIKLFDRRLRKHR